MTYATLMVHLELGQPNFDVLRVTADLAERFNARIIGIAACQLSPVVYSSPYMAGQEVAACQDELDGELKNAEADFRAALKASKLPLEWRSTVTCSPLPEYLAGEARCADLIITGAATASPFDSSRHTSIGDLVLRAGRPVLVVPLGKAAPTFDKLSLAWKDTREARRAAIDALPFLRQAKHVTVVEIASKEDLPTARGRVEDVVGWLERHGISATPLAGQSYNNDDASCLDKILLEVDADLVIAGAYGHSRLREWAFGGVTHNLLRGDRCSFLTH